MSTTPNPARTVAPDAALGRFVDEAGLVHARSTCTRTHRVTVAEVRYWVTMGHSPAVCPVCDEADPQPNLAAFTPRRGTGPNARVRAASLYAAWRAEGVPSFVTGHEAYRLSGGTVGRLGDHGTSGSLNLSTVARRVEGSR